MSQLSLYWITPASVLVGSRIQPSRVAHLTPALLLSVTALGGRSWVSGASGWMST